MAHLAKLLPGLIVVGVFIIGLVLLELGSDLLYRISPSYRRWCNIEEKKYGEWEDDEDEW